MQDWYAIRNGQQFGPYSQLEVEQYFAQGRLIDSDQVWVPGWQRWAPGHEVRQAFFTSRIVHKQPVSRQPRRKRRPVWLILIFLCVASSIALAVHFWPDKNSGIAGTKPLGSIQVRSGGGSFENGGLLIEIEGSAGQSSLSLDVFEMDAPITQSPDLIDQSRIVVLEGNLSKLSGDIAVTMPIPENMLPKNAAAASDLAGKLLLAMEEDVYVPSLGQSSVKRVFLPATIDLDQKTISGTIRVDAQSAAALFAGPPQISTMPSATADVVTQNGQIRLSIQSHRYGYFTMTSQQGHFQVLAPAEVSQAAVSILLNELERQKTRIESIGFSFAKRTDYPIHVYLEDMEQMGLYEGSKFSSQGGILTIRRSFLEGTNDLAANAEQWTLLVTTAGHELMHLAQALYDARGSFKKNSPYYLQPSTWLDEAVATWYEAEAIGDPEYLSPNMMVNTYFSETALFFQNPESGFVFYDQSNVQSHGYGASLFIRHLTNRYGKKLPAAIYSHYSRQAADQQFAGRALNDALRELGGRTGEAWIQFVEDLRQRPASIIAGLDPPDNRGLNVRLDMAAADGKVSFNPGNLRKWVVSNTSGNDSQAFLNLKFSPANLMNQLFFLTPASAEAGETFSDQKGEIRIKVNSTGDCGLLVYTVADDSGAVTRVAGAPDSFLSTGSRAGGTAARQSEIVIPMFGTRPGSIREIRLVVVNFDESDKLATSSLEVEISYGKQALDINGEWALSMAYDKVHYEGDIDMLGTTYLTDIVPGEWFFFSNVTVNLDDQGMMHQEDPPSGSYLRFEYHEKDQSIVFDIKFSVLLATMNGTYDAAAHSFAGPMENYVDGYGLTHSGRFRLTRIG